ncbi:MAG TPA: Dyp-type peroxidase [Solirubrobacter sp.]|nr:Dyp-type peroxidase [Solirubrobacter sp.]
MRRDRVPVGERGPRWTYRPDMTPPTLYGVHPPGLATPQLKHGLVAAYDVDRDLRDTLEAWTDAAERMMRGGGMTVTIGVGPSLFDERFGLARQKPAALRELPPFPGHALDPAQCGGDLCVVISSDEPIEPSFAKPRWVHRGTKNDRGALGFRDGTLNLRRPRDLDRHVWVQNRERSWMVGGTFVVVRRIEILDTWRTLTEHEQEQVIGRDKPTGAPLGRRRLYDAPVLERLPRDAHIRVAAPRTANVALLRRGYDTEDGLLFLAFQRDPRRQNVPLQRRLAEHDALHAYTRHVASGVFAVPPGAALRTLYAQ